MATEIRPDEDALRLARRSRVVAEMEAADIDIFVIGRDANARYVSGTPRLWTAGSRAFGPGCVLVRFGRRDELWSAGATPHWSYPVWPPPDAPPLVSRPVPPEDWERADRYERSLREAEERLASTQRPLASVVPIARARRGGAS